MKQVLTFFIIIYILICNPIYSQNCLPSGIEFSNQTQIDEFGTNYPGCKTIEGNVRIEEDIPDNITNLNGLISLEKIGGNMVLFNNNSLSNLIGLNNLDTIKGDLTIQAVIKLDSLKGLDGLKYIGKNFYIGETRIKNLKWIENIDTIKGIFNIEYNDSLKNFSGLDGIKYIGNSVLIIGNPVLSNISTLNNISKIKGNLLIHANTILNDLSGLSNIDSVSGSVEIWNNNALMSLSGLNSLRYIGINLAIGSNQNLIDLDGINSLDSIGGYLEISNNNALQTLSGLGMLKSTGGYVSISSNPALQNMNGLNNLTNVKGNFTLFSNQNLNNLAALTNIQSISGVLYIGYNNSLSSLNGLNNFDANNLTELVIKNSSKLSFCSTQAICSYLQDPANTTDINSNASGCDSREEVENECNLPIQFIDFTIQQKTDNISIDWTVTNEFDIDLYVIEISNNGKQFSSIGMIPGRNSGFSVTNYSFNYINTLKSQTLYFRIKALNFDGTSIYSDIKYINTESKNEESEQIFPNPAVDIIFLNRVYNGKIKIYTPDGCLMQAENCINCKSVNIKNLNHGLYILSMEGKLNRHIKFIKI